MRKYKMARIAIAVVSDPAKIATQDSVVTSAKVKSSFSAEIWNNLSRRSDLRRTLVYGTSFDGEMVALTAPLSLLA